MTVCWEIRLKSIKQTFTDHIIPDEMFTITIFELESLRNIRSVTNISDDINDFEYNCSSYYTETLETLD